MRTKLRVVASMVLTLLLGIAIGVMATSQLVTSHSRASSGHRLFQNFELSFDRLASRSGTPKSTEQLRSYGIAVLSLQTTVLGQGFDRVENDQEREEIVRVVRLIEANPKLQRSIADETTRSAAVSRRCILDKYSNPSEVAQCVDSSLRALAVKP